MYSPETYEGHWKQLTVRTTRTKQAMAIVFFNPQVKRYQQFLYIWRNTLLALSIISLTCTMTFRNLKKKSSALWKIPWRTTSQRERGKRVAWPLCTSLERVRGEWNVMLSISRLMTIKVINTPEPDLCICVWRTSPNLEDLPCELVAGERCIHEELLNLKFRISPHSFFQVSSKNSWVQLTLKIHTLEMY